jgi:hypothetical protein
MTNEYHSKLFFNSLIKIFFGFELFYSRTCRYLSYILSLSLGKFKNFIIWSTVYGVTPYTLNKYSSVKLTFFGDMLLEFYNFVGD